MPAVDFTPYDQAQGSTSDGTKFTNLVAAIQSTLNALDDANIAPGAGIALSKLATNPLGAPLGLTGATASTRFVGATASGAPASGTFAVGDFAVDQTGKMFVCTVAGTPGTWVQVAASSSTVGEQLDRKTNTVDVTGITASTEGTATAVITGNSIAYDGTENKVEFFVPKADRTAGAGTVITFVLLRDSTVIGQVFCQGNASGALGPIKGETFDTPSAASHTYKVSAFVTAGDTFAVRAGAGVSGAFVPAVLRVTKA